MKAFQKKDQLSTERQNLIERKTRLIDLFYQNPYMIRDVEEFRLEMGIPQHGFDLGDVKSHRAFTAWRSELESNSEPFEEPPSDLFNNEQSEETNHVNEQGMVGDLEDLWEREYAVNSRAFHDQLTRIYERYSKNIRLNDYPSFEWYAIYCEVRHPFFEFGQRGTFISAEPTSLEQTVTTSQTTVNGELHITREIRGAYDEITPGQPTVIVETKEDEVLHLSINIKPETTRDTVHMMWPIVEKYQQRMSGYVSRIKSRRNLERDIFILTKVKLNHFTYSAAIEDWLKEHPDESLDIEDSAIQHAVERLDKIFKPTDI